MQMYIKRIYTYGMCVKNSFFLMLSFFFILFRKVFDSGILIGARIQNLCVCVCEFIQPCFQISFSLPLLLFCHNKVILIMMMCDIFSHFHYRYYVIPLTVFCGLMVMNFFLCHYEPFTHVCVCA